MLSPSSSCSTLNRSQMVSSLSQRRHSLLLSTQSLSSANSLRSTFWSFRSSALVINQVHAKGSCKKGENTMTILVQPQLFLESDLWLQRRNSVERPDPSKF